MGWRRQVTADTVINLGLRLTSPSEWHLQPYSLLCNIGQHVIIFMKAGSLTCFLWWDKRKTKQDVLFKIFPLGVSKCYKIADMSWTTTWQQGSQAAFNSGESNCRNDFTLQIYYGYLLSIKFADRRVEPVFNISIFVTLLWTITSSIFQNIKTFFFLSFWLFLNLLSIETQRRE